MIFFLKKIYSYCFFLLSVPIYIILYLIWPFYKIRIGLVLANRIGHITREPEYFLRRIRKEGHPKRTHYFFLGVGTICNQQFYQMLNRKLPLIRNKFIERLFYHSRLEQTRFYFHPHPVKDYPLFVNVWEEPPALAFTNEEIKKGQDLLKKMGITTQDWFVCFHSRDSQYLKNLDPNIDWSYHNFRDTSVENLYTAMEYIAQLGGFSIRMGQGPTSKLPVTRHPHIIDYANKFQSDFLDVYLSAHCKFFVGNDSGLSSIACACFNIPTLHTNMIPYCGRGVYAGRDLFLPKKLFSKKLNRCLTIKEVLHEGGAFWFESSDYEKRSLVPIENSADEVFLACQEINQRIDGTFITDPLIETYREKLISFYDKNKHPFYFAKTKISSDFLRLNKDWLEL